MHGEKTMNILATAAERFGVSQAEPDASSFKAIYDAALEKIADVYREGDKESLDRQAPSIARRIRDLDREIDRLWFTDLTAFSRAVDEWQRLWLQGCEVVHQSRKETSQTDIDFTASP